MQVRPFSQAQNIDPDSTDPKKVFCVITARDQPASHRGQPSQPP
jgi:hypothetical protein